MVHDDTKIIPAMHPSWPHRILSALGWILAAVTRAVAVVIMVVAVGAVFALWLTPLGLLRRLLGLSPLQPGPCRRAASYWTPRPGGSYRPKRCERMY